MGACYNGDSMELRFASVCFIACVRACERARVFVYMDVVAVAVVVAFVLVKVMFVGIVRYV
jgi:hypothetical protein